MRSNILADAMVFSPEGVRHLVAEMGASQVVFGTDTPFGWPVTVDPIVDNASLSNAEKEADSRRQPDQAAALDDVGGPEGSPLRANLISEPSKNRFGTSTVIVRIAWSGTPIFLSAGMALRTTKSMPSGFCAMRSGSDAVVCSVMPSE